MTDETLNATVIHREDASERLTVVRVAPSGWTLPDFTPGQYATLGLADPEQPGEWMKRIYSVASAPNGEFLEFFIERVKEGEFTRTLWPLDVGDELYLSPQVAGGFTLDRLPDGADLALFGTGTGVAPFMSMVRAYAGSGRWRRCVLVHGARVPAELPYRAELEDLAAGDESFTWLPTVTREDPGSGWAGARGRMQALLEGSAWETAVGAPLSPETWHAYLCGSPGMVDDMEARLAQRGFTAHTKDQPGNLHFERWW
ncbi:MAG: ferredoxin--NADP reductase [Planctomycetota bacterium]|jgi:ferredoxin--NADP+ reductase